jgi:glycerol kinase
MQFQADVLGARIVRPKSIGSTALGAAYLAGIGAGLWKVATSWAWTSTGSSSPTMSRKEADALFAGWKQAVARVLTR